MNDVKNTVKIIEFDNGNEFNNKIVKEFMDSHNIKYTFFDKATHPNSIMIVERFNRTIR